MNLAAATVSGGVGTKKFMETRKNGEISSDSLKDSPRSVSDLKFTCSPRSQDSDSDILDLDRYDLTDDDESWLYSNPAGKVTSTDITAWLKKDADNLDAKTRRALAVKLEAFLRRKNSAGTISNDSCDSDRRPNALKETNQTKIQTMNNPNVVATKLGLDQYELNLSPNRTLDDPVKKNSDLNPDIKDIQLLASMQEQDLRQCLQQLNTRRRMTPDNQDRLGTSPKAFFGSPSIKSPVTSFSAGTSPKWPADLSATFVKPRNGDPSDFSATYVKPNGYQPPIVQATPKSYPQKMAASRKISTPGDFKKLQKISSLPTSEKHFGLRKSLPNLAASRSGEFCLPVNNNDSNSEKGSCGDIPNGMSPSHSSQRIDARSSNSRLPTPSRTLKPNSTTFSKSSIPVPRSRAKSPAPKMSLQTRLVDRYNWQDGCI